MIRTRLGPVDSLDSQGLSLSLDPNFLDSAGLGRFCIQTQDNK